MEWCSKMVRGEVPWPQWLITIVATGIAHPQSKLCLDIVFSRPSIGKTHRKRLLSNRFGGEGHIGRGPYRRAVSRPSIVIAIEGCFRMVRGDIAKGKAIRRGRVTSRGGISNVTKSQSCWQMVRGKDHETGRPCDWNRQSGWETVCTWALSMPHIDKEFHKNEMD